MTAPTLDQSAALAALDARAQQYQAQNAAKVAGLVLSYWLKQVDQDHIAQTSDDWIDYAITRILAGREQSYLIQSAYTQAVANIQIPGAKPIDIPKPPDPPREKLRTSLVDTGPKDLAIKLAKTPEALAPPPSAPETDRDRYARQREQWAEMRKNAFRVSGTKASAVAFKETANGGRDTTDILVVRKVAIGYVRVTKTHPCAFCLMLASRGPVYTSDSFSSSDPRFTGPGNHKVHDSCACTMRPVFVRGKENWTDQAKQADDLWRNGDDKDKAPVKYSGKDAINAFARLARRQGIADLSRY